MASALTSTTCPTNLSFAFQYVSLSESVKPDPTFVLINLPSSLPSTISAPSFPTFLPVPSSVSLTVKDTSINGLTFNHNVDLLHS